MPSPASAVRSLASRIEPRSVTVHGRYPCRLLDTTFVSARYGSPLGAPPHRASEPPAYEVGEGQQQQHRADRAEAGYQVVDGGHEVVRRVADGRGEAQLSLAAAGVGAPASTMLTVTVLNDVLWSRYWICPFSCS